MRGMDTQAQPRIVQGLVAGGLLLWSTTWAWAARSDGFEDSPVVDEGLPWKAIAFAAVALVGTLVVGFKNAKRTHLD